MAVRCGLKTPSRGNEACRVMPNSYPEWRNVQFAPNDHYRFFFLPTFPTTIAFRLEYVLFYQLRPKTSFLNHEMFGLAPLLYVGVKTFGGKWRQHDVKTSKWRENRHPAVVHESRLTTSPPPHPSSSCKTTLSNPGRVHRNSGRVCKEMLFLWDIEKRNNKKERSPTATRKNGNINLIKPDRRRVP